MVTRNELRNQIHSDTTEREKNEYKETGVYEAVSRVKKHILRKLKNRTLNTPYNPSDEKNKKRYQKFMTDLYTYSSWSLTEIKNIIYINAGLYIDGENSEKILAVGFKEKTFIQGADYVSVTFNIFQSDKDIGSKYAQKFNQLWETLRQMDNDEVTTIIDEDIITTSY